MRGVSEVGQETEQMLGNGSVDICCAKETRFRVKSFKMISGMQ